MEQHTLSILLAVDEREPSNFFLTSAASALSSFPSFDLHLVTVIEPSALAESDANHAGLEDMIRQRLHATAWCLLKELGTKVRRVVAHERLGMARQQILQCAADLGVDMICLGTHGRTGLQRLVLGSVAERVVREATLPVITFRAEAPTDVDRAAPAIEPPCSECAKVRSATSGELLWCEQHLEVQGRRHTYFQRDRVAEGDQPLGNAGLHL